MTTQQQLDQLIRQMQSLQKDIAASGQPPSRFELQALEDLGREYAALVELLKTAADDNADRQPGGDT